MCEIRDKLGVSMPLSRRHLLLGAVAAATFPSRAAIGRSRLSFDVCRFGASGNGHLDDTAGVQAAIDACARVGGGTVDFPAGIFVCGAVELRSHVTLHLAAGAILRASPDRTSFGERGALVFARGAENIAITGEGEIDGNHPAFLAPDPKGGYVFVPTFLGIYDPEAPTQGAIAVNGRPRPILLIDCRRVHMRDIAIRRSASWTVHLLGCDDVVIDGITIDNDLLVPNCDGIDVDHSRRVRIANCAIRAGDDGICLKTSAAFNGRGPCTDIVVTNCTLTSGSTAIKLGSAGVEPIRDVIVSGCVISDSNRGLGIQNRDGSLVENISFSDCVIGTRRYPANWWGAAEPIHVSSTRRRKEQSSAGRVRGINFSNIRCEGESGAYLFGEVSSPLEDIVLNGVQIAVRRKTTWSAALHDLRPSWDHPSATPTRIAGLYAEGINGLTLNNVSTRFEGLPDASFGSALVTRRLSNLQAGGFSGRAARRGIPDRDLGIGQTERDDTVAHQHLGTRAGPGAPPL